MELLKKIVLSSCILSVVISIADSINPGEKFARQLKLIFSVIFISCILVSAMNADFDFELPAISGGGENIEGYEDISSAADRAVLNTARQTVTDMVCRILTSQGIGYEKITADINMNDDGSIDINEIGYSGSEYYKAAGAIKNGMGSIEVKNIE